MYTEIKSKWTSGLVSVCSTGVYMQATFGQIYASNNYCNVFSFGFHISVIIASNMMQIKFVQTSQIVNLIFKFIISFHWSL